MRGRMIMEEVTDEEMIVIVEDLQINARWQE